MTESKAKPKAKQTSVAAATAKVKPDAEGKRVTANAASRLIDERIRELGDSKTTSKIRFNATLLSPRLSAVSKTCRGEAGRPTAKAVSWTFLSLPKEASAKLPSRGMVSVEGTLNGFPFQATLEPDGQGSHWLKVDRKMREAAGAEAGDVVTLEIAPVAAEPEPPPAHG